MKHQKADSEFRTAHSALRSSSANVVWAGVVVLGVLHQDVWWWDDKTLLLGFLPIGLAYHVVYSIAAALLWAAAVKWAWPTNVEQWADELEQTEALTAENEKAKAETANRKAENGRSMRDPIAEFSPGGGK